MYVYIDDYGVFKASHLDETLYNPVYKISQRQIWVTYSILYNGSNNTDTTTNTANNNNNNNNNTIYLILCNKYIKTIVLI